MMFTSPMPNRSDMLCCAMVMPGYQNPQRSFSEHNEVFKRGTAKGLVSIKFSGISADICQLMIGCLPNRVLATQQYKPGLCAKLRCGCGIVGRQGAARVRQAIA